MIGYIKIVIGTVMLLWISFAQGEVVSLTPVADAFASSANPGGFYGISPELWVRSWSGTSNPNSMKAYVRFKLPDDMTKITGAELTFVRTLKVPKNLPYRLCGLKKESLGQRWREHGGATWNNAPANDTGSISGFTADASDCLASVVWPAGDVGSEVSISSTAELVDFLNTFEPGGFVTLMLAQDQDSGHMNKLASRENKQFAGPGLNLTYEK